MNLNWIYKKIGEVMLVERGGSPRPIQKYLTDSDNGINWIKISDATASDKYIYETKQKITKEGLHKTRLVNEGDFLLSNSMSFGRPYIMKTSGCIHDGWLVLKEKEEGLLDKDFLYHLLGSPYIFEQFDKLAAGSTVRNLNISLVSSVSIPIPPLSEQQQIIEILDEAFEAIDQAKANIEKNIENAKELFQSKLNDIFSQKGEGWEEKTIVEICNVVNGYSFKSKDFSAENEVKAIKITNVGIMEFVEDLSNNLPSSFLQEYSKVKVHEGDLVLALTRTIISGGLKVARVPESYHNSLLNQRVAAIVPNIDFVDSDYLYYYFSSDIVYNYVLDNVNQLMQPNLSITDLKRMTVPITSIEGQRKISVQIEDLSEKTNSLINNYQTKLDDVEELKKSILQKAFAGELTNKTVEV